MDGIEPLLAHGRCISIVVEALVVSLSCDTGAVEFWSELLVDSTSSFNFRLIGWLKVRTDCCPLSARPSRLRAESIAARLPSPLTQLISVARQAEPNKAPSQGLMLRVEVIEDQARFHLAISDFGPRRLLLSL